MIMTITEKTHVTFFLDNKYLTGHIELAGPLFIVSSQRQQSDQPQVIGRLIRNTCTNVCLWQVRNMKFVHWRQQIEH
jgi:formamidopyrimidine-DNA glycosylase